MTLDPPSSSALAAAPSPAALPVVCFSYDQIHQSIVDAVEGPRAIFSAWRPTLLLCISGGGLVPTRILRSSLRRVAQKEAMADGRDPAAVPNVPVQCVGLQLYDTEGLDPETSAPVRTQWIRHDPEQAAQQALDDWRRRRRQQGEAPPTSPSPPPSPRPLVLQGQRVLVVDEVDDSRATLAACCAELEADAARERRAYEALVAAAHAQDDKDGGGASPPPWADCQLAVFVVHNKRRPKRGILNDEIIMSGRYFAAQYLPNCWCKYPWDADDIASHAEAARRQHAAVRVLPAVAVEEEGQAQREQRARRRTDAAAPELLLS
jgi:hypoxanthine phosphoribosyltransferase